MIDRKLKKLIKNRLLDYPAVALLGPRQVGKTTLAKLFSKFYYDLELEEEKLRLDLEWEDIIGANKPVILDEAQNYAEIFPRLRSAIDARRDKNGRFLILGSVSPALMRNVSDLLTGRIAICELTPFSVEEINQLQTDKLWLMGGYPQGGILKKQNFPVWQQNYLALMAMRDLPAWGLPAKPQVIQKFFKMIAATHGNLWNASQIGKSLGLNYHTVNSYLEYLQQVFLIRVVPPFSVNLKKRLVKSPKIFWRDTGLLHTLLNVVDRINLIHQPWVGFSWEGWVIEQVIIFLNNHDIRYDGPYFFRTSDGDELDLVINIAGELWGVEVKLSSYPGKEDIEKLKKCGGLIKADKMALISRTRKTAASANLFSTNIVEFLKLIA